MNHQQSMVNPRHSTEQGALQSTATFDFALAFAAIFLFIKMPKTPATAEPPIVRGSGTGVDLAAENPYP